MTTYRLAELFAIRPTGVPFEVLESLNTSTVSAAAREILARTDELAAIARAAADSIEGATSLSFSQRKRLRKKLFGGSAIAGELEGPELARYREALAELVTAQMRLGALLAREYEASRERLYAQAAAHLPAFTLVQLTHEALDQMLASRTAKADRTLAMWLQRVCSKNDTISRFGPSSWGTIDPDEPAVRLVPEPGITRNVVWIERWVVNGLIAVINADPEVRPELAPRVNPTIELAGTGVRWHETGAETELSLDDRALVARCDGRTPAYQLEAADQLARLAEAGLVIWKVEPTLVDDAPLATLTADVAAWRDLPPRRRWQEAIRRIAELGEAYRVEVDVARRHELLERLQGVLVDLNITQRQRTGRLYEAANPLVENCTRAGDFVLGQRIVDELVADATPWFELFRDVGSVATDRVYDRVRELYLEAPRAHGRLSMWSFFAFAESRKFPLRGPAMARVTSEAFREVRQGFARRLAGRADAPEWELTPDECRFLAGPGVPRPEQQYPSADLCLAARSRDAIARGDYRWVISELHHGLAPTGQALSWSCPDRPRLYARLRDTNLHQPTAFYDVMPGVELPVHTGSESMLEALEGNVASVMRTKPAWKTFSPVQIEVVLDEEHRDVRLRCTHTGADLGSVFPFPRLFFGMHPFFPLQLAHHTPRLVRGRTVFQRRAWVITAQELGGPFDERSPALVVAVERLRAARDLPRWVFLRIRDEILSGADFANRGKDIKPICIDLESYVFLEILARRLHKYGAVELVEMLPAPHELPWEESDGHRSFEIRTLLAPARGTRV